jgi:hypothetical protein
MVLYLTVDIALVATSFLNRIDDVKANMTIRNLALSLVYIYIKQGKVAPMHAVKSY